MAVHTVGWIISLKKILVRRFIWQFKFINCVYFPIDRTFPFSSFFIPDLRQHHGDLLVPSLIFVEDTQLWPETLRWQEISWKLWKVRDRFSNKKHGSIKSRCYLDCVFSVFEQVILVKRLNSEEHGSWRKSGFDFQYLNGSSQSCVTPFPGDPTISFGLCGH